MSTGRPCTVCGHKDRTRIDEALIAGESHRVVSKRFGLGETATYRHKAGHLVAGMVQTTSVVSKRTETVEVREVARADRLVDHVEDLRQRALRLLDLAEGSGAPVVEPGDDGSVVVPKVDLKAAAGLIREARGCLDLQARLLGEITAAQHGANSPVVEALMTALLAAFEGDAAVRERLIDVARRELVRLTGRR